MNVLKYIIKLFLVAVIISGCQKEFNCEDCALPAGDDSGSVKSEWEFDEAFNHFTGPVDTAFLNKQDNGEIVKVTGRSLNNAEKIFIIIKSLNGPIKKGSVYKTNASQVKFYYYNNSDTIYKAVPYEGGDISFTVTDIDSNKIKGTFSGSATDDNNRTYAISNGKFSSPLKKATSNGERGSVILWANELCNGPIKVKVNDVPGEISINSFIAPDCGDEGRASYTLKPGVYPWAAYCGKDSVTGSVEVKANTCSKILVKFPFKPPDSTVTDSQAVCKLSNVTYGGCLFIRCDAAETFKPQPNNLSATFLNGQVSGLQYVNYAAGTAVSYSHTITNEANKIIIDKGSSLQCDFITGADGRVTEYRGLKDPAVLYPIDSAIIKYEYDNAGNLVRRTMLNARYMTSVKEIIFTWDDSNIVQITERNLAGGGIIVTDLDYYTGRHVQSMPFIFTQAFELLLLQPAINMGNFMRNPVKTATIHAVDANGNQVNISYNYGNYIIDNNDYVLGLTVSNGYGSTTNFSFNYACF
jgi:hypothetical protein